jgi:hypothetical protein
MIKTRDCSPAFYKKQATLMRRSTVLNLSLRLVFPAHFLFDYNLPATLVSKLLKWEVYSSACFVNGTARFKKCEQEFEYQHLLLLRDIW